MYSLWFIKVVSFSELMHEMLSQIKRYVVAWIWQRRYTNTQMHLHTRASIHTLISNGEWCHNSLRKRKTLSAHSWCVCFRSHFNCVLFPFFFYVLRCIPFKHVVTLIHNKHTSIKSLILRSLKQKNIFAFTIVQHNNWSRQGLSQTIWFTIRDCFDCATEIHFHFNVLWFNWTKKNIATQQTSK